MAISKRLRFEILRRDDFRCRYCGATPNEAELQVDHVTPTSLGGDDSAANLATSCAPCNSGKGSAPLDGPTVAEVEAVNIAWTAALHQAAREAEEAARERERTRELALEYFEAEWSCRAPRWAELPDDWEASVVGFLGRGLSMYDLDEAIGIATSKDGIPHRARFNYFAGICWNKVRDLEGRAREIMTGDQ